MGKKRVVWLFAGLLLALSMGVQAFPFVYELSENLHLVTNPNNVNEPSCTNAPGTIACKSCFTVGGVDCAYAGQGGCSDGKGYKWDTLLRFVTFGQQLPGRISVIGGEAVICRLNGNDILGFYTRNNCGAYQSFSIPAGAFVAGENTLSCGVSGSGRDADNGFKLSAFSYKLSENKRSGTVKLKEAEKRLGIISELVTLSDLQGSPAWSVTVASLTPEVMVWVNKPDTYDQKETTDPKAEVWACLDSNTNRICDANEGLAQACLKANGDWYKGKCCGTDYTSCQYVGGINAICGKPSPTTWEWAPLAERGEIHPLLNCPGGSVLSDGSAFYQCGGKPQFNATPFGQFRTVATQGVSHEYYCVGKNIYECAGSRGGFSSVNSMLTGQTTSGSGLVGCPDGMVAYWKFDTDTAQDSVGANHGTAKGVTYGPGPVGRVAVFDGTDDRIEVPSAQLLNPLSQLTVEAWIYPSSTSGTRAIVNKGNAYELVIQNGVLKGAIKRAGSWTLQGTAAVSANTWSHVAMTYDGSKMRLYLNGAQVNEFNMTGAIDSTPLGLFIGDKADALSLPNASFAGNMDEVAVYDRALTQAELGAHAGTPATYCASQVSADVYYCASDGDWTQDLDSKDQESCTLAGFQATGSKCCSEIDDPNEYYNDRLGTGVNVSALIAGSSNAKIVDKSIILNTNAAWVKLVGPAQVMIDVWSEREAYAGTFELCNKLSSTSKSLAPGQFTIAVNLEPGPSVPEGFNCTHRVTNITVKAAYARGGCWNKQYIETGQFAVQDRVINYHGSFYGCRITDDKLKLLKDSHTNVTLINNSITPCGMVLYNARPGGKPHAVCRPNGSWEFTDEPGGTINKSIAWAGAINMTGIELSGCCAEDQCWNGTRCQPLGSFYRVGDKGFVCRYP